MSKKAVNRLISYVVAAVIGGLMVWIVASNYGLSEATTDAQRYRILCDAFTIPGVTLVCLGVLSWIARQGTFDGLTYAFRFVFHWIQRNKEYLRYYDYIEEQREKREQKEKNSFLFLLITGAVFLLVAGIFMALFYSVYE